MEESCRSQQPDSFARFDSEQSLGFSWIFKLSSSVGFNQHSVQLCNIWNISNWDIYISSPLTICIIASNNNFTIMLKKSTLLQSRPNVSRQPTSAWFLCQGVHVDNRKFIIRGRSTDNKSDNCDQEQHPLKDHGCRNNSDSQWQQPFTPNVRGSLYALAVYYWAVIVHDIHILQSILSGWIQSCILMLLKFYTYVFCFPGYFGASANSDRMSTKNAQWTYVQYVPHFLFSNVKEFLRPFLNFCGMFFVFVRIDWIFNPQKNKKHISQKTGQTDVIWFP